MVSATYGSGTASSSGGGAIQVGTGEPGLPVGGGGGEGSGAGVGDGVGVGVGLGVAVELGTAGSEGDEAVLRGLINGGTVTIDDELVVIPAGVAATAYYVSRLGAVAHPPSAPSVPIAIARNSVRRSMIIER